MIGVRLDPVDTWFFRDGTPFTAQSAPQEDVGSLFPPHPPTLVGALRAALARANGWNGQGQWCSAMCDVLGDGPEDLGAVSFAGPFLLRDAKPLFRAPRHLLGASDSGRWEPRAFLSPGAPVTCDLGDNVRLPELNERTLQAGDDEWLTPSGLNAALRGQLPGTDEVESSKCLWSTEPRIGLARDDDTRSAKEGMLYSSRHVRLHRGVSLGVRIAGVPADWTRPFGQLAPLGGESRLAELQEWDSNLHFDAPLDQIKNTRRVVLTALSPLDLEQEIYVGKTPLNGLGGIHVVSACLERPQRVGGWNSGTRRPLALRSVLPPGSALFCEIRDAERFADAVAAGHGTVRIGSRREWGFGIVAPGVWPDAN